MRSEEPFEAVCSFDPAIDAKRCPPERLGEYIRTRDMDVLAGAFRTGEHPMVFRIRNATRFHEQYISSATSDEQSNERAFACLVVSCKSLWTRDKRRVDKDFTSGSAPDAVMSDDELVEVPWLVRQEIGLVANRRARFLLPWTEPLYPLPPGSASALEEKYASKSPADESPESSTNGGTESSSKTSTARAPSSGAGSAEPTAATAQESA